LPDAFAGIANATVRLAHDHAVSMATDARNELARGMALLAFAVAIAAAGFAFVRWRPPRPMAALRATRRRLAGGDLGIEVTGGDRADELGEMGRIVQVIREGVLRAWALERESARARLDAEGQRRAAMRVVAYGFERAVGGIVATVSAAATETQATAEAMTGIANETTGQSTTAPQMQRA